jgi:hypothetical protein
VGHPRIFTAGRVGSRHSWASLSLAPFPSPSGSSCSELLEEEMQMASKGGQRSFPRTFDMVLRVLVHLLAPRTAQQAKSDPMTRLEQLIADREGGRADGEGAKDVAPRVSRGGRWTVRITNSDAMATLERLIAQHADETKVRTSRETSESEIPDPAVPQDVRIAGLSTLRREPASMEAERAISSRSPERSVRTSPR